MNNYVPAIKFEQKIYGINMRMESSHFLDRQETNLVFKFYLKRDGILKRWDQIRSLLHEVDHSKMRVGRERTFSYFKKKEVTALKARSKYSCTRNFSPTFEGSDSLYGDSCGDKDLQKRETSNGNFKVNETLEVIVEVPLSHLINFTDEYIKVSKLRNQILAINAKIKAEDRLNSIQGKSVTPEYEPKRLEHMRKTGNHNYYAPKPSWDVTIDDKEMPF